ncbi:16716_t:CDS:2, partial [Funneliformis mosseae]
KKRTKASNVKNEKRFASNLFELSAQIAQVVEPLAQIEEVSENCKYKYF